MKKQPIVFHVDDNAGIRETVRENLMEDGFSVITAAGARECLTTLEGGVVPDIVLLDLELPDGNGLTLIREIRRYTPCPILMVSGKSEMSDKVVGLDMGADDYIGKPIPMPELVARINAHLRRSANRQPKAGDPEKDRIVFGTWIIDRARLQIFGADGSSGNLTVREFRLLEALALSPNRVLSREQLISATRDDGLDVFDRAIDIQITRIRRKIGDDARSPRLIRTVRGAGYMLVNEG